MALGFDADAAKSALEAAGGNAEARTQQPVTCFRSAKQLLQCLYRRFRRLQTSCWAELLAESSQRAAWICHKF